MRRLALGAALAIPLLNVGALVAFADEGSPVALTVSPAVRPPVGVLRHVDAARTAAPNAAPRPRSRELIVLVGGYQSCACDGTFEALQKRITASGDFDVLRFGSDPRFPYDTFGDVATNATVLRDQIRAVTGSYDGVHIVTHSMGGVVADQAFAHGLSATDGVVSYVSWAAPHSGSDAARATVFASRLGAMTAPLREGLLWLRMEPESQAVDDLARARPVPPPPGVVRLDLRHSTDVLVTDDDARDPGVPSRVLKGSGEGHGDILNDPRAIEETMRTIVERRVPPDVRPRAETIAAEHESRALGTLVLGGLVLLVAAACAGAVYARGPGGLLWDRVQRMIPRASRRACP